MMTQQGIRPERDGPGLLVMAPTRELAQQTETEANRFGRSLRMKCVAMYGGAPKGQQMARHVDIPMNMIHIRYRHDRRYGYSYTCN